MAKIKIDLNVSIDDQKVLERKAIKEILMGNKEEIIKIAKEKGIDEEYLFQSIKKEFYNIKDDLCISVAVDAVVFFKEDDLYNIFLVKRKNEPFKGYYALPGGFIELGESAEEAIRREVKEELGINIKIKSLVTVQSKIGRDPRGQTITIAYLCEAETKNAMAGDDAETYKIIPINYAIELAFDHNEILEKAKKILM
ncbi:MAG: NUDIX domain-containing protein [Thermoplasmata archaeon]